MYSELAVGKPQKSLRRPRDNTKNVSRDIFYDVKWVERAGFVLVLVNKTGLIM
jgi:hypothetical protein